MRPGGVRGVHVLVHDVAHEKFDGKHLGRVFIQHPGQGCRQVKRLVLLVRPAAMGRRQECRTRGQPADMSWAATASRQLSRRRRLLQAFACAVQLHVALATLPCDGRTGHARCGATWQQDCWASYVPGCAELRRTIPRGIGFRALRGGGDGGDGGGGKGDTLAASQRQEEEKLERDKALIGELQAMRNERSKIKKRLNMLAEEIQEHAEAAQVLERFDGARPCKRAIGGVLIDSTAGEVLPALHKEMLLLTKASKEISAKLDELEANMESFRKKHDIRIVSEEFENAG